MSNLTQYKSFMTLNPEISKKFNDFLVANKELVSLNAVNKTGVIASILNGKNKGITGLVEFIGFTRLDKQYGSKEQSVCIKQSNGVKVWTKVHNTQVQEAA